MQRGHIPHIAARTCPRNVLERYYVHYKCLVRLFMPVRTHRTQTQQETRNVDSDLLVPDFATRAVARKRQMPVVLLEGKVVLNRGRWHTRARHICFNLVECL